MSGKALCLCLVGAMACSPGSSSPVIEALGGGSGYWPADSRVATEHALEQGYDAIQLDVGWSVDEVLVVVPALTLDPSRCTTAGGDPLDAAVGVSETLVADLDRVFCGGEPEEAYPNATTVAGPPLRFTILLEMLRANPEVGAHLGLLRDPRPGFVEAVVRTWRDADLPNALSLSSQDAALLGEARAVIHAEGTEAIATAAWRHPGAARDLSAPGVAEGLWIHVDDLTARRTRRLRREGWWVGVWGVENTDATDVLDLDVDRVLTAYPEDYGDRSGR